MNSNAGGSNHSNKHNRNPIENDSSDNENGSNGDNDRINVNVRGSTSSRGSDGSNDGGEGEGEDQSSNYNGVSTPERWILVLAMIILGSGVVLLALRSVIFSLILLTIGISLFAYWLYTGVKAKEQKRLFTDNGINSSTIQLRMDRHDEVCTCPICNHTQSDTCLKTRCPCCLLIRNKQIIGHFNNPLQ